jgi:single-strand DNA-binding protein
MSINNYVAVGHLTRDPELKELSSDKSVCELRLAVDGMGRGGEVGYINVSVYGKAGQAAAQYLTKGRQVAVQGRLEFAQWETDAGDKRHDYSIVGNVDFLSSPRAAGEDAKQPRRRREPAAA